MEEQQATDANLTEIKLNEATLRDAKSKAEAKAAESKLMSISIAMFMAIVAMLGAVTAYRAALAEQDTLRSERRLQQGEMLELVKRQELLSKISSRTRYENSVAQHSPSADSGQQPAGQPLDRGHAALKKLQAEEEAAHVRSLKPYLDYFDVDLPYPLEPSIAMHSAVFLRALGFDTIWAAPAEDGSFPNIWEKLEADVTRGQIRVLRLAVAVVLFVVALAFLTFAQLNHNKPTHEKVLVWIGGLLALSGLVMAMLIDRAAWKDFLMFTAGFGVLALIGRPLARKFHFANGTAAGHKTPSPKPAGAAPSAEGTEEEEEEEPVHPAEVDPALFAGMRLHVAPVAHRFGRFVISMIALSAVLSALSGYFYSRAAVKSSEATSAALADQAQLFRLNSREVTMWNYMVGRVSSAEDVHLRYEAARQRVQLAKEDPGLLSQKDAEELQQQRRKALEKFEKKEPEIHKLMTGELGPEQDVHFPRKMVINQSYHDPAKALAKWSADNEMSLGYQREATTFLALLTLFAIALYLLGQALGMGRTNAAFILVLFACGLVGVGVLRGLFIRFESKAIVLKPATNDCRLPGEIADKDLVDLAAEHFARGWVLYEGSGDDPTELAKAAKEFGCAAEIRPTFAGADLYFARATNGANTPQLNEGGFVSLIEKNALGRVSQAERDARKLLIQQGFAPPSDLVGNVGFNTYADGLVKGDRDSVEIGRQATVASLDLDKASLVLRFNLALAQLAEGNEKQALDTYSQTITLGDPGKAPLVVNHGAEIGGAITDLDVFRQYCTGLNSADYCKRFENTDLPKLKSELIAATWPPAKGRTLAGSGIKLTDLTLSGSAAELGWSGHMENLALDSAGKPQDTLAILFYAYSPDWKAWRVLPAISGPVTPDLYARGNPSLLYSVLQGSGARLCLQSGTYRAEFYVDGDLAGSQEITLTDENLKPAMFPDLDVAFCHPDAWKPWHSHDPDAVWTRGYTEDGNNRGAFIFSFFDPQQDGAEQTQARALRRAENILHNEGLVPAPASAHPLSDCTGLHRHTGETVAAFGDQGGTSIAKAWTTSQGLVNVIAVVDKQMDATALDAQTPSPSQLQTRQDCEILLSAITVSE